MKRWRRRWQHRRVRARTCATTHLCGLLKRAFSSALTYSPSISGTPHSTTSLFGENKSATLQRRLSNSTQHLREEQRSRASRQEEHVVRRVMNNHGLSTHRQRLPIIDDFGLKEHNAIGLPLPVRTTRVHTDKQLLAVMPCFRFDGRSRYLDNDSLFTQRSCRWCGRPCTTLNADSECCRCGGSSAEVRCCSIESACWPLPCLQQLTGTLQARN